MATSWLQLQNQLRSGAKSLATPVPADGCSTNTASNAGSILNLPDPTQATQVVNDYLSNVQGTIDQFGAEVMGVLQDIGAWIPPELQGGGASTSSEADQQLKPAAVDKVQQQNINPEVSVITGHNTQTGDGYYAVMNSSGSAMHLDADGSVIMRAAKNPSNVPTTGRFDVWADGNGIIHIGEGLHIQVKNNSKICGTSAYSLYVTGDIDIQASGGNIGLKGDNIKLSADKSLELIGADIKIHAGGGQGTAKSSATKSPTEYGGSIDMRCGTYKVSYSTKQGVETASYAKSEGEIAFLMPNTQGNFGIESAGTLSIKTGGDMLEEIGGRKMTEVMNAPAGGLSLDLPTTPLINGVSAGYYIVNKNPIPPAIGAGADTSTPPLVYIHSPLVSGDGGSPGHGFKFATLGRGDISFYSASGNWVLANENNIAASIITPLSASIKSNPKIITSLKQPGLYLSSLTSKLRMSSNTEVLATAGPFSLTPPVRGVGSYVKISPAATEVSNKTGIFLN
jgi:hypothetical protein